MSMFDNVVFDEFTILEGEQAEAYKRRKAKEANSQIKKEMNRGARYTASRMAQGEKFNKRIEDLDKKYTTKPKQIDQLEKDSESDDFNKKRSAVIKGMYALDALDRHERKQERKNRRKAKHEAVEMMIACFEENYIY